MTTPICNERRELVRRGYVERRLPPGEAAPLWEHLATCAGCRGYYEQVVYLDRMAGAGDADVAEPSAWEVALWVERIVPERVAPARRRRRSRWWLGALAGVAAAAAAVVIAVIPPAERDPLGVRGADDVELAIRAFCEQRKPNGEVVTHSLSTTPGPLELARCPHDAWVRLAYHARHSLRLVVRVRRPGEGMAPVGEQPAEGWELAAAGDLSPLPLALPPGFAAGLTYVDLLFFPLPQSATAADVRRMLGERGEPAVVRRIYFGSGSESGENEP